MIDLKNRSFLTLKDYTKDEIRYLLDLAHQLKKAKKQGRIGQSLLGKNIVLLFEKTSTRTRCAFEVAALDEGAHVTYLNNSQMGKKESIEDTAKVLGRMYDGIEFRGYKQETAEDLMKYSGVPVWNGLTDVDHPTQTLADFLTIEEHLDKPLDENEKEYYRKMIIRNLIIECCIILALLITKIYQFSFVMSLGFMVSALAVILQKQTKNQAS